MTRLGFVGVGRHAQKMATAFRECGAEVVAYDRNNPPHQYPCPQGCTPGDREDGCPYGCEDGFEVLGRADGFGIHMPWRDMIAAPTIDALIICATPEVTTEVALACAKAGKRCVATKPLMRHSFDANDFESASCDSWMLYVDLWRLASPAWQALKAELRGKQIERVTVDFYGNGPVRSFSGALDYGPHALAFVADLLGSCDGLKHCGTRVSPDTSKPSDFYAGRGTYYLSGQIGGTIVGVNTGNGSAEPRMAVGVYANGRHYLWLERNERHRLLSAPEPITSFDEQRMPEPLLECYRSLALRAFCRAFLAGEPSDTLRISCEAMKALMPLVS